MKTLVKMQSHADSSVMEAVNHFKTVQWKPIPFQKHGASSKSLMSRRNLIFSMILALVASVFMFYACGDDDDGGGGSNNFVYSEGFIENYGGNGGGVYNFDVTLHSSSMDFENETGSGNFLYLELWSSSSSGLANGKYTFSNSPKALSYTDGSIAIGYNLSTDRGQYLEIKDGDVNISTSGGETNISFEVTVEGNRKITGSYKGVLTMFDFSGGGGTSLSAPTGVTATQSGSSVNVSWNSVSGAIIYIVYRSSSSSGPFTELERSGSTSFTDSNPLSGNNFYRVVAVDSDGTPSSQSSSASVNFTGGGGGTPPSTPTGVNASQSGSSVNVSWSSVSGATSYIVYRSSSASGTFTQIGTSSSTSYTDNSPLSGNNSYRVAAVNNSGTSSQSSTASVNFTGGGGGTAPAAPTGLTATRGGPAMYPYVTLSWNNVSGATSYKIFRSGAANGSYSEIGTSTTTSYTDNNPISGDNHYRVRAVNSAGESSNSNTVQINTSQTFSPCPPSVTVTRPGSYARIVWSFPTTSGCGVPTNVTIEHSYFNSATSYRSPWKTIHTTNQASGNYNDNMEFMLGVSVTNYYRVTGTNSGSESGSYTAIISGN